MKSLTFVGAVGCFFFVGFITLFAPENNNEWVKKAGVFTLIGSGLWAHALSNEEENEN